MWYAAAFWYFPTGKEWFYPGSAPRSTLNIRAAVGDFRNKPRHPCSTMGNGARFPLFFFEFQTLS